MSKSKHDQIAERLAKKFGAEYKSDFGIDIVTPSRVVEVESKPGGLDQGIHQVEHATKARYIAVPRSLTNKALGKTEGTGIGVMSETGKIIKRANRKGW